MEYIIVGDTEKYNDCLIYVCGKNKQRANDVLARMLHTPNEQDKAEMKKHKNIRVKEVNDNDCWWNDPWLCN